MTQATATFAKLMSRYIQAPSVEGHGGYRQPGSLWLPQWILFAGTSVPQRYKDWYLQCRSFISSKSSSKSLWQALSPGVFPYGIYCIYKEYCQQLVSGYLLTGQILQANVWIIRLKGQKLTQVCRTISSHTINKYLVNKIVSLAKNSCTHRMPNDNMHHAGQELH